MFDPRFIILRVVSGLLMYYGIVEFVKDPASLDDLLNTSSEVWNDVHEWGQNKFMGVPDNSTVLQVKKSARQIYAEAFMEDENPMFTGSTRAYADYADEEAMKEEFEKK